MNRRMRVLIVDDVPVNLKALADLLRPRYEVLVATSGPDALEVAQGAEPPDLILLDIIMPDMDGFEVCTRLKSSPATQNIPIVFITARTEAEDETLGFDLGGSDYVTKPFDGEVVLARVRHQLDMKRTFDALRAQLSDGRRTGANHFRKSGHGWSVRFQGGPPFILKDTKGAAYLSLLLAHPNRHFPVEEAAFSVSKEDTVLAVGSAGRALDDRAFTEYRARVEDLIERKDEALRNNDPNTAETAQAEIDWIVGELKRSGVLSGHLRQEASDRERLRKSIGNAIRRALAEIADNDPALAMHLSYPRLRLGFSLVYEPNSETSWDF